MSLLSPESPNDEPEFKQHPAAPSKPDFLYPAQQDVVVYRRGCSNPASVVPDCLDSTRACRTRYRTARPWVRHRCRWRSGCCLWIKRAAPVQTSGRGLGAFPATFFSRPGFPVGRTGLVGITGPVLAATPRCCCVAGASRSGHGNRLFQRLPEQWFRRLLGALIALAGVRLLS